MKHLIETVNRYKAKSADPIRDQQVAYIPRIQTDQIDFITSFYILEGKRIPVNITNQLFVKLKYLDYRSISIRKFLQYRSGVYNMHDLVNNKIIIPFMVFINGWFVPWEYLQIAIDSDIHHLIINGATNDHIARMCKNCDFIQIVTLPEYATCVTDYDNPLSAMFVFDEYGKYDMDNVKYCIVSATGHYSLGFNYWHTDQDVNAFKLLNQTDIKLTEANIMLFVNGLFASGTRDKTPRGIDGEYEKDNGHVAPCVDFTYSPNFVIPNPDVRIDSVLLSINNGKNDNRDVYDFGLFVNPNYTYTIDNISRVDVDKLAPVISDHNINGNTPEYLANLRVPFEMKMSTQKMYAENLGDALRAISRYNTDLFTSIFMDRSNLVIEERSYEWIQAHLQGGAIILPISYGDNRTEYVVVLVNGRLYEYSHMIKYYTNKVLIPIQNIGPEDTVEFLRFKNINNLEKKVIINANDGYINYSEEHINDNMALFSTEYNGAIYDFPEGGRQHFEIPYTLLKNSNGLTKVILDDPFYYGKELTMTYRDRFKWEVFTIEDLGGKSEYVIDLGDRFKYCNQYHRYLVFLNNTRLSSDHFRLVLPVRPTTPFTEFKIYLTIPVTEGDRLDIMYTPALFQDIIVRDTIDTSGDIVIDKSVLDYGLTTDLYMIWINGKKVAQSNISDIDTTHIRVTSDEKSTNALSITKFIPSIDAIDKAFDENTALWDTITSVMSAEDINKLLGIKTNTITDTEPNRYEDAASIKAIMNDLIRDEFLMNPSIDVSGPFVYDYLDVDTTVVGGYDSGENAMLETTDANHEDNLGILDRVYP